MTRSRRLPPARGLRGKAGFALLAVIWGTGVISLLVVSFMSTGRLRLQTASNIAGATQASYIAEGVINQAAMTLLGERDLVAQQAETTVRDGRPEYCVLAGAAIAFSIEDESGKVDLNAAPQPLLQAMLMGLGLDKKTADNVANSIIAFRTTPGDDVAQMWAKQEVSEKPFGPKKAPFETIMELDQVSGIDAALFRSMLPFVTVQSRTPGVDPLAAPPGLFAALAGFKFDEVQALTAAPYPNNLDRKDPRFPVNFRQPSERAAYLIHAEALLATGQTAAKDAIVDLRGGIGGQLAIRELRRGQSRYLGNLRDMIASNGAGVPDC